MKNVGRVVASGFMAGIVLFSAAVSMAAAPVESARMLRAKDLISEDQWVAAIGVLKAAVADPREQNKDEALFWLAHSQNQAGDLAESVESIRRLQREFPKSRWSAPASSLLIELAQKLGQKEFLWWTATPPVPPAMPEPPFAPRAPRPRPPRPAATTPTPPPPAPPVPVSVPVPPQPPTAAPPAVPIVAPSAPPPPPPAWVAAPYEPDVDVRVLALSRLMPTDAPKVIPMLRTLAIEHSNQGAVFVLAQSRNPDAHRVVVDVAMTGPEVLRPVAVRDLALFGDSNVSEELLRVYSVATAALKQQVVNSLGQRADAPALFKIVKSERDPALRERAIVALGRAGGSEDLRPLYGQGSFETRQAIVTGLCGARDVDGLIWIADQEKDANIRKDALGCLRLMGTARAKTYLSKEKK